MMPGAKNTLMSRGDASSWTFLTNRAHVLICIAREPDIRIADLAGRIGIGERATHRILRELKAAGYVTVTKEGRRNVYQIDLDRPLRHPLEAGHQLRAIVDPLVGET